jgi:F420-non-reducing hydrogenase iron-sulfur subunit
MMKLLGIEEARLRREWISASEGQRFAEVVREFTEEIRQMGRNTLADKETAA